MRYDTDSATDGAVTQMFKNRPGSDTQSSEQVASVTDNGETLNVATTATVEVDSKTGATANGPTAPSQNQASNLALVSNGLKQALGQAPGATNTPSLTNKERKVFQSLLKQLNAKNLTPFALRVLRSMAPRLNGLIPLHALNKLEPTPRPKKQVYKNYTIDKQGQEATIFANITEGRDATHRQKAAANSIEDKKPLHGPYGQMKEDGARIALQQTTLYADELNGTAPAPSQSSTDKKKMGDAAAAQQAAMKRWMVPGAAMAMDLKPN